MGVDLEHILEDILADHSQINLRKAYSSPQELFHFIVTNISFGMRELPADLDLADARSDPGVTRGNNSQGNRSQKEVPPTSPAL